MDAKKAEKVDAHGVFRAFTACSADPKVLILDVRSNKEFKKKHLCLSYNIRLSTNGKVLADYSQNSYDNKWSQDCWWGKAVVVYGDKDLKKDHPVINFLSQEGRCHSLQYFKEGFEQLEASYPFLCTTSVKQSAAKRYPSQILPGLLYLGDWQHAQDVDRLQELNINRVITVHNHPENLKLPSSIRHLRYELADIETSDISPLLAPAFDFIEQAQVRGEAVLVHCGAGVSRSATLVMAYLMRAQRISAAKARQVVTGLRSVVCINDGFWRTLCALEAPLDLPDRSDPTQGSGFRGHDAVGETGGAAAVEALGQEVLGERVQVRMITAKELQQQAGAPAAADAAAPSTCGRAEKQPATEADKPRGRSRSRDRRRSRSRSRGRRRSSSRERDRDRKRGRSRSRERGRDSKRGRSRSREKRDAAAAPAAPAAAAEPPAAKPKGGRVVTFEVKRGDTLVGQLLVGPMRLHHKCVVGRAPSCDVVLEHLSVSRAHAQLSVDNSGQVLVMDLGSGHGTNLDGTWLKANTLRQVRVGSVLKFGASTRGYKLLSVVKE